MGSEKRSTEKTSFLLAKTHAFDYSFALQISVSDSAQVPVRSSACHRMILFFTTTFACSTSPCVCGVCGRPLISLIPCFFKNISRATLNSRPLLH